MTERSSTLEMLLTDFNSLMFAGKNEKIGILVAQAKKDVKEARSRGEPAVQSLAKKAMDKLEMLELGLKRGHLTPEQIEDATQAAKELEDKLGRDPSPIVQQPERQTRCPPMARRCLRAGRAYFGRGR